MTRYVRRLFLGTALLAACLFSGCEKLKQVVESGKGPSRGPTKVSQRSPDNVSIASFNIQVFGQSKLKKTDVMEVLAKVVRRFDVVAIQEVRSTQQDVLPKFVQTINADGSRYDFVIGPRLGRTDSKEQYAFVFDTTRIRVIPNSMYTVPDPTDQLHRPPFVASFVTIGNQGQQPFSFTLINIHTDPDETKQELDALDDAFLYVKSQSAEDDVILLGDLNVDEKKLGELGRLPNITWTVSGAMTNTRLNKSYDNIVFDKVATSEYTGQWGVLNLMEEFGLTEEQALKVSDHMPVWAVFTMNEGGRAQVAARPAGATR